MPHSCQAASGWLAAATRGSSPLLRLLREYSSEPFISTAHGEAAPTPNYSFSLTVASSPVPRSLSVLVHTAAAWTGDVRRQKRSRYAVKGPMPVLAPECSIKQLFRTAEAWTGDARREGPLACQCTSARMQHQANRKTLT